MVYEYTAEWTTAAGGGFVTVMHYEDAQAPSQATTNVVTFLGALIDACNVSTSVRLGPEVRQLDDATGQLIGATPLAAWGPESGLVSGEPLPDATQGLIRWGTAAIANGKRVRGRMFVPGMSVSDVEDGNLTSAAQTALQGAALVRVNAPNGAKAVVWHRPVNGAGGSAHAISDRGVSSEWAVLRRRRR